MTDAIILIPSLSLSQLLIFTQNQKVWERVSRLQTCTTQKEIISILLCFLDILKSIFGKLK